MQGVAAQRRAGGQPAGRPPSGEEGGKDRHHQRGRDLGYVVMSHGATG